MKRKETHTQENKIWKQSGSILQYLLTFFGVIVLIGTFVAYLILTTYLEKIEFSANSIETYVIFSIAKHFITLFGILFIVIMAGTVFSYEMLEKNNKDGIRTLWWVSSLMLIIFFLMYFSLVVFFDSISTEVSMILSFIVAALTGYVLMRNINNSDNKAIIFGQTFYSLVAFSLLTLLYINTKVDWWDISVIIIVLLIIHACPFVFILFFSGTWGRYQYLFLIFIVFVIILWIIRPNSIREASIRSAHLGEINYKNIKVTDEECTYLNKYYEGNVCKKNMLTGMKGLWLQGDIYYFQDKNGKYKIKRDNIIYKVKVKSIKYFQEGLAE